MRLYSLTHLTGRTRNINRPMVIMGIETSRRGFIVAAASIAVSIIPTLLVAGFTPPGWAPYVFVLVPGLFVAAAFLLIERRSRHGLELRIYREVLDRKRSKATSGQLMVCFQPLIRRPEVIRIVASSVPVATEAAPELYTTDAPSAPTANLAPVMGVGTKTKVDTSWIASD